MKAPTLQQVLTVYRKKGYPLYLDRDYDMNFFGIRTNIGGATGQSSQTDLFDDWIGCIWKQGGKIQFVIFPGTTDPGRYWLQNPMNRKGTAIMVPGHYPALWKKGPHGSRRIDAFRQNASVKVWRDADRDTMLDMGPDVRTETGVFWINMHPASYGPLRRTRIGKWGAGCQVLANWNDFSYLRRLRDLQIRAGIGDTFSYSLFTRADFI